ncbi:hypothetical protein QBC44DRAFT_376936 [Cladorrhinum sp. PSN332]|nr:hypothetical protein QBC44DRAFT_376936 [Cladorrhinum sp. PSN332]
MAISHVEEFESEFKDFLRLPAELRTMIWEYAQPSFIHVLYPQRFESKLAWTLVHGGVRIIDGALPNIPNSLLPTTNWKRRFDSRLLACYESAQIAERQLAAEKASGQQPEFVKFRGKLQLKWETNGGGRTPRNRDTLHHFGSFFVDPLYLANSKWWGKHQSKGVLAHASVLFSLGTAFMRNPSISRLAIRTSPAALDSLDLTPADMMVHPDEESPISAKDRSGQWRTRVRSL